MSYVFSFTSFSLPLILHLALVAASISHVVTAATKFSCCSSNKQMSPLFFFISRSRFLSPILSLGSAGLPPTLFFSLSFSCSIFQICGHENKSKLITLDNTDTETISALLFSCDAGGYAISRQNNLELRLGCHTCWSSYFTLVCLWCGRTVARAVGRCTVTLLPNFLGWVDLRTYAAPLEGASCARELRYEPLNSCIAVLSVWIMKTFQCYDSKHL